MAQARGVVEVSLPDPDAALAEPAGLLRAADTDADLLGGQPLEESLGDATTKLTGSSGDERVS
jgi:hypothetical protein